MVKLATHLLTGYYKKLLNKKLTQVLFRGLEPNTDSEIASEAAIVIDGLKRHLVEHFDLIPFT